MIKGNHSSQGLLEDADNRFIFTVNFRVSF